MFERSRQKMVAILVINKIRRAGHELVSYEMSSIQRARQARTRVCKIHPLGNSHCPAQARAP